MFVRYLAAVFLVLGAVSADRVPVMMWSNEESVVFPRVLAGHSVSTADFEKNYIEKYAEANKNLIVFVQNKLSIADISHYANIYGYEDEDDSTFHNVKELMTDLTSTHLPNVVSPVSVFETNGRHVSTLDAPYDVEDLITAAGQGSLGIVLVRLSDLSAANYQNSLKSNDKIIGDVIKQLDEHGVKYTAFYTAMSSGKKSHQSQDFMIVKSAGGRQLLADSTPDNTTANHWTIDDGVLLYLGGLNVSNSTNTKHSQALDLHELVLDEAASSCNVNGTADSNSSTCILKLKYLLNEPVEDLNLTFTFSQSSKWDPGYWFIKSLQVSYKNSTASESVTADMNVQPIGDWSPFGFSFSCNSPDIVVPKKNDTQQTADLSLIFYKLQVQAYGVKKGQFGYYNDCEPFFSTPIWMALISMSVMLGVLVFGLYMLCQITTMDRFDDPKGKTIIVAAGTD